MDSYVFPSGSSMTIRFDSSLLGRVRSTQTDELMVWISPALQDELRWERETRLMTFVGYES